MIENKNIIFLAHASEDKPFVRKLYAKLKVIGLNPWLDEENLRPGIQWDQEIKQAIGEAKYFIACISSNSITKSGYIQKELRLALKELEQKAPGVIYFIPALIEDVPIPNITVGTIDMKDYHAIKIYESSGVGKLISLLTESESLEESKTTIHKYKTLDKKGLYPDHPTFREKLYEAEFIKPPFRSYFAIKVLLDFGEYLIECDRDKTIAKVFLDKKLVAEGTYLYLGKYLIAGLTLGYFNLEANENYEFEILDNNLKHKVILTFLGNTESSLLEGIRLQIDGSTILHHRF